MNEYAVLEDTAQMSKYEGRKICLKGQISRTPWQHMIGMIDGYPVAEYFDVDDYQIVIYSKEPIQCTGSFLVYGMVIKIEGEHKNPARKESATEYHLRVDKWECQ